MHATQLPRGLPCPAPLLLGGCLLIRSRSKWQSRMLSINSKRRFSGVKMTLPGRALQGVTLG